MSKQLGRTFSCVTICDGLGRIIFHYDANSRLVSDSSEMIGRHIWDWSPTRDDQQELREGFVRCLLDNKPVAMRIVTQGAHALDAALFKVDQYLVLCLARDAPPEHRKLSERELTAIRLLCQDNGIKQIAARMDCAVSTAATHLERARQKIGVRTLQGLAAWAVRHGIS